jgi:hypothetical protein
MWKARETHISGDLKETPPLMCTYLYHCLPPLCPHPQKGKQHQMGKSQQQICLQGWAQESLRLQQPTFLRPMNLTLTLSPPVLTPQLPMRLAPRFNQEHLNSPNTGLASIALQMPLSEVQIQIYYDQHGQTQRGRWTFVYQPFTTTDLLNWKHHIPSFTEKPQVLIELMLAIIQTHKPTWTDCQQLLLTLNVILESMK